MSSTDNELVEISEADFFASVGQLDVTPHPVGKYNDGVGYTSHWKLRNGTLIGVSTGGTVSSKPRYWRVNRKEKM